MPKGRVWLPFLVLVVLVFELLGLSGLRPHVYTPSAVSGQNATSAVDTGELRGSPSAKIAALPTRDFGNQSQDSLSTAIRALLWGAYAAGVSFVVLLSLRHWYRLDLSALTEPYLPVFRPSRPCHQARMLTRQI